MTNNETRYLIKQKEQCVRRCKLKYRGVPYIKNIHEYCITDCALQVAEPA